VVASAPSKPKHTLKGSSLWLYLLTLIDTLSWKVAWVFILMLLMSFAEGVSLMMLVPMLQFVGLDVATGTIAQLSEIVAWSFGLVGVQPTLPNLRLLQKTHGIVVQRGDGVCTTHVPDPAAARANVQTHQGMTHHPGRTQL
jgi:hypothetical protein